MIFSKSYLCQIIRAATIILFVSCSTEMTFADRLVLRDGSVIEADSVWEDTDGVWWRRGGVTQLIERIQIKSIERQTNEKTGAAPTAKTEANMLVENESAPKENESIWIHLTGGARLQVDSISETGEGVWYHRGNLTILIERNQIARIEREVVSTAQEGGASAVARENRGSWSTGNRQIDSLIKANGQKYGVDPFLIFCVMEQESHFRVRAVSPKGASGLMQLMPGTAARFGVRRIFDPAQNIAGGTRYLKELLERFGNRVDLMLASYNAGEGAVLKYGHSVPPYRETRDYVRRISARYQNNIGPKTLIGKAKISSPMSASLNR